jgi:hypothetical protein
MSDLYSVKINPSEGSVEVSAPDREWLESKLTELLALLEAPTSKPARPARRAPIGSESTSPSTAGKPKSKPRASGRTGSVATDDQLAEQFTDEVAGRLETYMAERPAAKAAQEQVVAIAGFLSEELQIADVGEIELNTVYTKMGWPLPAIRNALQNGAARKNYFTRAAPGRFQLTRTGFNFARHESKTAE